MKLGSLLGLGARTFHAGNDVTSYFQSPGNLSMKLVVNVFSKYVCITTTQRDVYSFGKLISSALIRPLYAYYYL